CRLRCVPAPVLHARLPAFGECAAARGGGVPHVSACLAAGAAGAGRGPRELRLPPARHLLAAGRDGALAARHAIDMGHDDAEGLMAKVAHDWAPELAIVVPGALASVIGGSSLVGWIIG